MADRALSTGDFVVVLDAVEARVRSSDYAGADPFDGLAATHLPETFRSTRRARQAVVQALKRSPVDLRAVLGVKPRRIGKAIGLFASAYAMLDAAEWPGRARQRGQELLDWLVEHRRQSTDPRAWGYEFDVQTRWAFYPAGTPNVIVTTFVGNAFLDWYERTADERLLSVAGDAAQWIIETLAVRDGEQFYFGYVPGVRALIHNANALAAGFLARFGRLSGDQESLAAGSEAIDAVVSAQRPDGLWPYGEGPSLEWVDGFHTAYTLGGLLDVWAATGDETLLEVVRCGTRAYADTLFDGPVARFSDRSPYPIDVHCASSAIDYFTRASVLDPGYGERAWNTAAWAIAELYDPSGRFYYQRTRWYLNNIAYIRWSDAHMMRALARLLAQHPS